MAVPEGRGLSGLGLTAGFSRWLPVVSRLAVIGGIWGDLQGAGERASVVLQQVGASLERFAEYMNVASRSGFGNSCTPHIETRQRIHREATDLVPDRKTPLLHFCSCQPTPGATDAAEAVGHRPCVVWGPFHPEYRLD